MKGLSLTQPWASLVAIGAKRVETRSWSTNYRGVVAIHASKEFKGEARGLVFEEPFYSVLHAASLADIPVPGLLGVERLPQGAIVAVGRLTGCFSTFLLTTPVSLAGLTPLTATELAFGDFTAGRWGWRLADVRSLSTPLPCRGALGLWSVPAEVILQINAQLGIDAEVP